MSGHERRRGPSPHWLPASMLSGVVGVLYVALPPFGREAWTDPELLIRLAVMVVLLVPAGAAIGLVWGLALWAVLSPLAARRRKAPGCADPGGRR